MKLSQQLIGLRETRTQRVIEQQRKKELSSQQQATIERAELANIELSKAQTIEEYSRKYNQLSPELKQFFIPPKQLITKQQEIKVQERSKLEERIKTFRDKIERERERPRPSERRLTRYEATLESLENSRDDIARGASFSDVLKSARRKGTLATEPKEFTKEVRLRFAASPRFVPRPIEETMAVMKAPEKKSFESITNVLKTIGEKDILSWGKTGIKTIGERTEPFGEKVSGFLSFHPTGKVKVPSALEDAGVKPIKFERPEQRPTIWELGKPTTLTGEEFIKTLAGETGLPTAEFWKRTIETGGIIKGISLIGEKVTEAKPIIVEREKQAKVIEKVIPEIEKLNKELEEKEYRKRSGDLTEDIKLLNAKIQVFNLTGTNGGRGETLRSEAAELKKEQTKLTKLFEGYEKGLDIQEDKLEKAGIKTEEREGLIEFHSKALDVDISPAQIKVQKLFLEEAKRKDLPLYFGVPAKTLFFGGAQVIGEIGKGYALGAAAGTTGVLAKLSLKTAGISKKIGTLGKIGAVTGGVLIVGGGVGLSAYRGYKVGKEIDQEVFNAVLAGSKTVGRIGGFVVGGVHGTKVFQEGVRKDLERQIFTEKTIRANIRGTMNQKEFDRIVQFGKQKGVIPSGKIVSKPHLEEVFVKGKAVGFGRGKGIVELTAKGMKIRKEFLVFTAREVPTGAVRMKVFFPEVTKTGTIAYKDVTLLVKQTLAKDVVKGLGVTKQTKLMQVVREIRILSSQTIPASKVPFAPERAFDPDIFKELKGLVFAKKEFAHAVPLVKGVTSEKVFATEKGFITEAKGLGISHTTIKDLVKRLETMVAIKGKKGTLFLGTEVKTITKPILSPIQVPKDFGIESVNIGTNLVNQIEKIITVAPKLAVTPKQIIAPALVSFGSVDLAKQLLTQQKTLQKIQQKQKIIQQVTQKQVQQVTQKQMQKQLTKQIITPKAIQDIINIVPPSTPTSTITPRFTPPRIPIIPFLPDFRTPTKRKRKKKLKKRPDIFAFLPTFTAKALGLEPIKVTQAQAEKLVRQELTGFEIRPGARLIK